MTSGNDTEENLNSTGEIILLQELPLDVIDRLFEEGVLDELKLLAGEPTVKEYLSTLPKTLKSISKVQEILSGKIPDDLITSL